MRPIRSLELRLDQKSVLCLSLELNEAAREDARLVDTNQLQMSVLSWGTFTGPSLSNEMVRDALIGLGDNRGHELFVDGRRFSELAREEQIFVRHQIQWVGESVGLLANRTLRENILLPLRYHSPEDLEFANSWIQSIGESIKDSRDFVLRSFVDSLDQRPFDAPESHRRLALALRAVTVQPNWIFVESEDYFSVEGIRLMVQSCSSWFQIQRQSRHVSRLRRLTNEGPEVLRINFVLAGNQLQLLRKQLTDSSWQKETA